MTNLEHLHHLPAPTQAAPPSVLGWPAWQRMLVVLALLVPLWLAVAWASTEVRPW